MRGASLFALGLTLSWAAPAVAQDQDWNIFKPPWDQAKQMQCTEIRHDECRLMDRCVSRGAGGGKITFDFQSNDIQLGTMERGVIPDIRITGRTFYVLSKTAPRMALLIGDARLFRLRYQLTHPEGDKVALEPNGQLVIRRSKKDVTVVEPKARLFGFLVEYERGFRKEDELEVSRFECVRKEPGMLDHLKPLLDRLP